MWFLLFLLLLSFARCEAVNFQDDFRVLLRNKTNPCEGHVEVYYNNELGYVGDKHWDEHTEEVVCRSTHCGKPEKTSTSNIRRSMKHKVWLNELKCKGTEANLWDCPGWPGPGVSFYQKPTVKRVKCSDDIKISLKQHRCEGAVQFTRNGKPGYICKENFEEEYASTLCEALGCGEFDKMLQAEWMVEEDFRGSEKMMLNCSGLKDVTNLWQCVRPASPQSCLHPASVSCTGHEKLQLKGETSNVCSGQLQRLKKDKTWEAFNVGETDKWCKQMHCGGSGDQTNQTTGNLTCSDRVKVMLMENKKETKCYGEVNINVNDKISPVCDSGWGTNEAEVVCQELNCGKILSSNKIRLRAENGIMDHVKCDRDEASLWHCRAKHGKISCSSVPKVFCAKSMDVKLVDGPGKCSGRLEVLHEGKWKQVSNGSWTVDNSNQVCKQLKCGEKIRENNKDKFKKGAGDILSLQCSNGMSHISECTINPRAADRNQDPVGITCEEHKVVFLDGPESCSGRVGIERGDRTDWLSGSEETWNQDAANTVCQQLHCGTAENFTSEPYNDTAVRAESYSCSANHKSLFDCNKTQLAPSDSNGTVANVMCTGKITVNLTNTCWGFVSVSAEGKSGGIYAETWTEDMSKELCKELKCGDKINPIKPQTDTSNIIWKSLHARSQTTPLNKYTFVEMDKNSNLELNDLKGRSARAYVVCKDSVKPRFRATRDKCSGNIEMHYEGQWLPVLKSSFDAQTETQSTVCKKLKCGDALFVHTYFGPSPAGGRVVKIKCSDENFSSCDITHEKPVADTSELGALQCSDFRKVALEVDYACKGEVSIYSKDTRSVVSSQNWTKTEGDRLCRDLNCGDFKLQKFLPLDPPETVWKKTFRCPPGAASIWECEQDAAPSELNNKLYIECDAEPVVNLNRTKCDGELMINGDRVCNSQWKLEYSHRVCQELNCGNAVGGLLESSAASTKSSYQHVHCDEHNYIIGQCHRVKGTCAKPVTIFCTESVSFNMTGNCNGYLTINYREKDEDLCKTDVSEELLGNVCGDNKCGAFKAKQNKQNQKNRQSSLSLHCPSTYKNMRYCVAKESTCDAKSHLHIECEKSVPHAPPPPPAKPINPVPILVGVGIVIILVILIVIFIRYRIITRNRKARVASNMLPEQEGEWDSGEYEDVDKSDEIEDFNQGFRSESEIKREKDVESNASFSYDDIDEVAEARPLTSPGSTDAASKNKLPNPNDDGVTYEVEDSQENYDDIDASAEAPQTRAEVHDGPETTQKTDATAPQESEKKDEDYLVPGQDG